MSTEQDTLSEDEAVNVYLSRLNGRAWGIAIGFLAGTGLFLATITLVLKGGQDVGAHLSLLANYFPFYSVTIFGSFIGFAYAFVVGYLMGRVISGLYNLTSRGR